MRPFSQPHEQTQKVLADLPGEQELEQAFERWSILKA